MNGLDDKTPTAEEMRAIRSLHRLAARWPTSLWIWAADGRLYVMRKGPDGRHAMRGSGDGGVDHNYVLDSVLIESDGGDW